MTNVLVGIIGVILFIGLAIAGALFLGPQFKKAQINSKAMAITQMATQIAQASTLYRTERGVPLAARVPVSTLKDEGYLAAVPLNPYVDQGGLPFRMLYSGDLESSAFYADLILVSMGSAEEAEEVCRAIRRQVSGSESVEELPMEEGPSVALMATETIGCFRMHDVGIYGEAEPHSYVVYSKV